MSFMKRVRSCLPRVRRKGIAGDESGATAVEFAMVAPVFFLMLGVVLETGLMMFTEYVLQTSVQEAARLVRTGQAQEAKMNESAFKTEVCKLAGIIIDCEGKVTVYLDAKDDFSALSASVPSFLSIGTKPDGTASPTVFECGNPEQSVALIATYDWNFIIPYFMSFMGNINNDDTRRMAGFAMFKNEPYPAVPGNVCG